MSLSHSSGIFPKEIVKQVLKTVETRTFAGVDAVNTKTQEAALEKASDDGTNWTELKTHEATQRPGSSHASLLLPLSLEIRGTSPFRQVSTPVLGMVHRKEGEGLGGPDGASGAETGHQFTSLANLRSGVKRIRCLRNHCCLKTLNGREGRKGGRDDENLTPWFTGKKQPRRGFPMLR